MSLSEAPHGPTGPARFASPWRGAHDDGLPLTPLSPGVFHPFRVVLPLAQAAGDELRIEDMAEVIGPGEKRRLRCAGERVTVSQVRGEVCRGRGLEGEPTIQVADNVHVKVNLDRATQDGILTLATDLVDEFGELIGAADLGFQEPARAEYAFRADPSRSGSFELGIYRGVVVVDLTFGVLALVTPDNVRSTIVGGQVVIGVGDDGATLVFVVSGTLVLPDGSIATDGELVQLDNQGVVAQRATPARPLGDRLASVYSYNRHRLWAAFRPWWAAPYVYVPAAVGLGTGGYFLGREIFGGDHEVPVIISIPAPF